jgi:small nuclear ribonucleoprotein (snRNP)-like protein
MFRKCFSLILAIIFFCTTSGNAVVFARQNRNANSEAEKIKRKVLARGTGVEARVTVKLSDGSKVKGYVNEAADKHFVVVRTDDRIGQTVRIEYREVKELKGHVTSLSSGARKALVGTLVAVGITVGVVGLFLLAIRNRT